MNVKRIDREEMGDEQQRGDEDEQDRDDAVERLGFKSGGPMRPESGADQAAGQEVQDDEPVR